MNAMMTHRRFAEIVAAYGADPGRWPEDERAAAETFAREDDAAAAIMAQAARLDAALDQSGAAGADAAQRERILDIARGDMEAPARRRFMLDRLRLWPPATALAASLLLGLALGLSDLAYQETVIVDVDNILYGDFDLEEYEI